MQRVKIVFIHGILLFLFHQTSLAQCASGNCKDGYGTYLYPSGAKYTGDFYDHLAHGNGRLEYANGDVYEGEWNKHVREGRGKLTSTANFVYQGDFVANKFHGQGKITFENKDVYEGTFKEGAFHGIGKYTSVRGSVVEGEWLNGEPVNKKPKIEAVVGVEEVVEKEEVTQSQPVKNCNGIHCHREEGQFVYGDGTVYSGYFIDGEPNGPGTVYYANGDVYIGGWRNHAPDGEGVVQYFNGRSYGAIWDNGKPIKELAADHRMIKEAVQIDHDEETKIWAVIIGVSRYNHMPTLKYTDDDAFHLYAFLKSPEGGALPDEQISLLIDEQANRTDIIRHLQQTLYRADDNDVVLLYFSGHGLQGRMIPSDFDGYNNAVQYDEIKNIIEQSNAKHKIVIADACHSGSLLAARNPLSFQLSGFYQQLSDAQNGIAFITSSKSEEVSLESSGLRHGIFSHYLIKGLQGEADVNQDATVSIAELYQFVQREVKSYTNDAQNPLIFGDYDPEMPIAFVRR